MVTIGFELLVLLSSVLLFSAILTLASLRFRSVSSGSFCISTFHALTILLLTSKIIFSECWDSAHQSCRFNASSNSALQQLTLAYSMGYFIVDSFVVTWLVPDVSAALHHVSILIGQAATIFYGSPLNGFDDGTSSSFYYHGVSGYPLACFLFAAELSAPFLNAFMSGLAPKGSSLELMMKSCFAFTFLVSRLFVCPFLIYEFVAHCPNAPVIPKAVCVFVMGISIYWSKAIVSGILEVVLPKQVSQKVIASETFLENDGELYRRVKGE
jgi:hypothetical protein